MELNRKSLVAKIAGKGIITPYEAIYLQYLNNQHIKSQELDVEKWDNFYLAAEDMTGLFSQYDLKNILSFQSLSEISLYDSYRWAAIYMTRLDTNIGSVGYKTIALLDELRLIQNENSTNIVKSLQENISIENIILDLNGYSKVYGKNITFGDCISLFSQNIHLLIISIDNILTLNYYLQTLAEKQDLNCLDFLRLLFSEEKPDVNQEYNPLNLTQPFYKQIVNLIIENNHEKFVEFMKRKIMSFNTTLNENFYEGSMLYVKNSLYEMMFENASTEEKDVSKTIPAYLP